MTETLQIPKKVIDSDWKDDVDLDFETYGTKKEEREYVSPTDISRESIGRIKARKLQTRGHTLLTVFGKNEKFVA